VGVELVQLALAHAQGVAVACVHLNTAGTQEHQKQCQFNAGILLHDLQLLPCLLREQA
jgi:hypothetical protein